MSNLQERLTQLSPEQRALVLEKLRARKLQDSATNGAPAGRPLAPIPRDQRIPLSFAQQRLWFLDQLGSESAYNIASVLQLQGDLDGTALERAVTEIVRRHESLRTTFQVMDGQPYQVIASPSSLPLLAHGDISHLPTEQQAAEVQRLAAAEAIRPFDLRQDQMVRVTLLRLGAAEHVLLLTFHHIASDGWSIGVFVRELATLYAAFTQGRLPFRRTSPLPELPIQYADFAHWQRQWLQDEGLVQQLGYWRKQLTGAPPLLQLPTDRPRPALETFRGSQANFTINTHLTQQLRQLSLQAGTTLFMTLLAAFQVLLARYSGQEDIVVGSPIANRTRAELEPLIGFFVNTLALRVDLSGNPTFLALLDRVRQVTQDAYDHQDMPFERLVEELAPTRDLGYNPLVQVVFVLQNAPLGALELPGLQITPLETGVQRVRLDMEVHLWEIQGELRGRCIYNTDLFDATTIQRMMTHFQTLLTGIVADPTQRITTLPLLTAAERQQLLVEWNATQTDYPKDKGLHQLFEEQAARTPDAVAVIADFGLSGGQAEIQNPKSKIQNSLTYHELNTRANQLAHYLRTIGVGGPLGAETLVGLCVERSIEMVVGLLGILKAGGAYVPLDPAFPPARLAYIMEDAQPTLLLTQSHLLPQLPAHNLRALCLDTDWARIASEPTENPSLPAITLPATGEPLAYVIYTSGSTGQPKGVQITHRALVNFLLTMQQAPGITQRDVLLAVTTLAFDIAALELYLPLITGATVVIAPQEAVVDGQRLAELIDQYAVTMMQATPVTWRMLLASGWQGSPNLKLLCGGEAWSWPLADALRTRGQALWNLYGPTETTVWSARYAVEKTKPVEAKASHDALVPIGRPLANTQFYIVDRALQPVPIGVAGELLIGGDGLARGYHNQPAMTQEKFIPNPFGPNPFGPNPFGPGRLYRTGDLVRYQADGNIEFLGRLDNQVKIRGFRIELGEIEAVLSQHPAVREAVVVVRTENSESHKPVSIDGGEQRLVAYVIPQEATAGLAAEHVSQWQSLWSATYDQTPSQPDPTFNLQGWNSSYTGLPIPAEEMREWVEATVQELRALQPAQVLEIGCGSGLLLSRLAPNCGEYWGTDYAAQALQHIQRLKEASPELAHVQLLQRMADDFTGFEPGTFDLVILNSVVQYFPSIDYLVQVLEGAVRLVKPGGVIYVGDVRSLPLLAAYHASVQLHQVPGEWTRAKLQQRVQQRMREEEELLIDPAFFADLKHHLPPVEQVQIHLKRGHYHNEMTRFRYQVLLHVGTGNAQPASPLATNTAWLDWAQTGLTLSGLRTLLREKQDKTIGLRNVPNARLQQEARVLAWLDEDHAQTIAQLRASLATLPAGIEPEALWALGQEFAYLGEISEAAQGTPGAMDVLFKPHPQTEAVKNFGLDTPDQIQNLKSKRSDIIQNPIPWSAYANNPLLGKLHRTLAPQLRDFLAAKLPTYMLPATFVLLDAFPLTPNGKVDRRALPLPATEGPSLLPSAGGLLGAPSTPLEIAIADVWAEVLGLTGISVHDNFFALGGHSLLATQLISRLRQRLDVELPLRSLFAAPTIAGLAQAIEAVHQTPQGVPLPPIERRLDKRSDGARRTDRLPLSFTQQRLWFLDQLVSENPYNIPAVLKLQGALDQTALEQAVTEIVRRHESLRTTFQMAEGKPYQVIGPAPELHLPLVDLQPLPAEQRHDAAQQLATEEAICPFDLRHDLMVRVTLIRLATTEHILLLTMHHIAADGWSVGVFVRELALLYAAFTQGLPSPLPELSIQYADFAAWQRQWLQGDVLARQLHYWQEQLAGVPPLLALPTDRPRPALETFQGSMVNFVIDAELAQALRQLSLQAGTTLFMTLLAAFQILLARYSGQEDIVVGSPIANRTRAELEPLIGSFFNILTLRTNLAGNPSFLDLLDQVRQVTQGAYEHQELPFERIVEELAPPRDLGYNPLVQVLFALQNAPLGTLDLPGIQIAHVETPTQRVRLDLEVHLWEVQGELQGRCIYSSDLFAATTIQRMMTHFQTLLAGAVANPNQRIARLPLLTAAERHQLLVEWNATQTDYPKAKSLHQLFEEQVAHTPDAVALWGDWRLETRERRQETGDQRQETGDQRLENSAFNFSALTYGELNRRANQLAHYLQTMGVGGPLGAETLVCLCVERSVEMMIGLLGILKAGGTYVPLDPTYPPERLALIIADAGASCLLTQSHLLAKLPALISTAALSQNVPVLCLDTDWPRIVEAPSDNPETPITPEQLAYVIYTSGSTGQPKGVQITHRAVVNLLWAMQESPGMTANDVMLALATFAFDMAVPELYLPLVTGATLVLAPQGAAADAQLLAALIRRYAVTILQATPTTWRLLLMVGWTGSTTLKLLCGAEAWHQQLADELVGRGQALWNLYGPTETTVWSARYAIEKPKGEDAKTPANALVPLGRPLANTQFYIVDQALQPVPIGVAGELLIGGDGLARGYHNRPALTAEKFIPNPFGPNPFGMNEFGPDRVYRTGDLVRYRADGIVEFLGRIDNQVKIRGSRIELGEIEAVLTQHPAVQAAVVVVDEVGVAAKSSVAAVASANEKRLVAYVTPKAAPSADTAALTTEHIAQWQQLWTATYAQPPQQPDLTFNITGWNSSYTGLPIPAPEMEEWVEATVNALRPLQPTRVLEIGCGTGLVLARLAPDCGEYWATDYSPQAVEYIQRLKAGHPALAHVQLAQRMADDFTGFEPGAFDLVILNSVIQYFPSIDYLIRVLEGAVRLVKPGGFIYLGDVRSLPLLAAYHASVQCHQAPATWTRADLQQRVQQHLREEEELLIDPAFFSALKQRLPQITQVQISLKRGRYHNEMTLFRYQALLQVGAEGAQPESAPSETNISWLDWPQAGLTLSSLRTLLTDQPAQSIGLRNVPNARLQTAIRTLAWLDQHGDDHAQTVGQLRTNGAKATDGIEPEDLWTLGLELAFAVDITWSLTGSPGAMDILFRPYVSATPVNLTPIAADAPVKPWPTYANNPLLGKLNRALTSQLRPFVQAKLPAYMTPALFVVLDALPLNPNGKVNRQALPKPDLPKLDERPVAPDNEIERQVAQVVQAVLQVEKVGVNYNFFELGANSLALVQIQQRLQQTLGLDLPLVDLFNHPTIRDLAKRLQATASATAPKGHSAADSSGGADVETTSSTRVARLAEIRDQRHKRRQKRQNADKEGDGYE